MLSSLPVKSKICAQGKKIGRGGRLRRWSKEGGRKDSRRDWQWLVNWRPACGTPSTPPQNPDSPSALILLGVSSNSTAVPKRGGTFCLEVGIVSCFRSALTSNLSSRGCDAESLWLLSRLYGTRGTLASQIPRNCEIIFRPSTDRFLFRGRYLMVLPATEGPGEQLRFCTRATQMFKGLKKSTEQLACRREECAFILYLFLLLRLWRCRSCYFYKGCRAITVSSEMVKDFLKVRIVTLGNVTEIAYEMLSGWLTNNMD